MFDECDMSREKSWYYEQTSKRCIVNLKRHNINAVYVPDRDAARLKVLEMIPRGSTIGFADSVSVRQTGVMQEIEREGHHQVFNALRWEEWSRDEYVPAGDAADKILEIMRKALLTDVFITGVNAVTLDGKLVSIDSAGNRVAGMIFGPRKVIIVAGANKIVPDVDSAIRRIKEYVAPINCKRHALKHGLADSPCSKTGACVDCLHPRRICSKTVIIEFEREPPAGCDCRLNVVLVGEELGI